MKDVKLKRSISLFLLTFYGLGTILGAGIYALIGKISQEAYFFTPLAFLIASLVALFTALSYAELSGRFPYSAGSAYYIQQSFKQRWLSGVIGWLIILSGIISAAALLNGFGGYFRVFFPLPIWNIIVGLTLILGMLAIWGIKESAVLATIITFIEIAGLLLVALIGIDNFKLLPSQFEEFIPEANLSDWRMIFAGAFLAFYAFIGFEDMVTVAEEVKNPRKNIPIAIITALILATILYLFVTMSLLLSVPMTQLTTSNAPLTLIFKNKGYSTTLITSISLIALVNGILVQLIMATRVAYGLAKQNNAPLFLGRINPLTKTPVIATTIMIVLILILALWLPIEELAKSATASTLIVFTFVNLALIVIKIKKPLTKTKISFPIIIPVIGFILSLAFLIFQIANYLGY